MLYHHLKQTVKKDIYGNQMCLWVIRCTFPLQVTSFVEFTRGVTSNLDPFLFLWCNKINNLIDYILVDVEVFLFAGIRQFHKTIVSKKRETFQVDKEDKRDFNYIGLNIVTTKIHISLDQYQYINNLKKIDTALDLKSNNTSPLTSSEKDQLRAKTGQHLWVINQTIHDISFDVSNLPSKFENATIEDIKYCDKKISKVISNS